MKAVDSDAGPARGQPTGARSGLRQRLFATFGWAAVGFVVTAATSVAMVDVATAFVASVWTAVAGRPGGADRMVAAVYVLPALVALGFVGQVVVRRIGSRIGRRERNRAWRLFWVTTVGYALLINAMVGVANFSGESEISRAFILVFSLVVVFVGFLVLGVLAFAVVMGVDRNGSRPLRWVAVIALVAVPATVADPLGWIGGMLAGIYVAFAVDDTVEGIRHHEEVPAPALAASLMAATVGIVLVAIYQVFRTIMKAVFSVVRFAAEAFG
ncbi:MAG: hypothetical protein OXI79_13685 [Gammaproteobacteria bacterium]|nr:hypothetical protein [Gammaproteobacteria bacterium]